MKNRAVLVKLTNVRCWVNSGKHLLAGSISGFDPKSDMRHSVVSTDMITFSPKERAKAGNGRLLSTCGLVYCGLHGHSDVHPDANKHRS
jgi:hypothetical protein